MNKNFDNFKNLYEKIIENQKDGYKYYELYKQYLENYNEYGSFYNVETDELTKPCSTIKCMQISQNIIEDYNIKVYKGKLFDLEDYIYENGKEIPILMGYAYSTLYEIGDIFEWEYLFDKYKFKIIGFLEEGSSIEINTNKLSLYDRSLDKYIIVPSFEITHNVLVTKGLKIHYANKTSGIVKLSEDKAKLFYTIIESFLLDADVGEYSWTARPIELQFKDSFGISFQFAQKIIILCCIVLLFAEIGILYLFSNYGWQNKKTFFGNIINGVVIFLISSILYLLISYICMIFLGIILFKKIYFVVIAVVSMIIVFLCKLVTITKQI